jgi:hypothetical protein
MSPAEIGAHGRRWHERFGGSATEGFSKDQRNNLRALVIEVTYCIKQWALCRAAVGQQPHLTEVRATILG